ncbi:unnamed protein product, partial [Ectocarpus sp. 13 AM-2016]
GPSQQQRQQHITATRASTHVGRGPLLGSKLKNMGWATHVPREGASIGNRNKHAATSGETCTTFAWGGNAISGRATSR